VRKTVQIGAVILKIRAFKCNGLVWFFKKKTRVVDFIARWQLCYNFVEYRFNRHVQNNITLKCTKNMQNDSVILKT